MNYIHHTKGLCLRRLVLNSSFHMDYFYNAFINFSKCQRLEEWTFDVGTEISYHVPFKIPSFVFQRYVKVFLVWNDMRVCK